MRCKLAELARPFPRNSPESRGCSAASRTPGNRAETLEGICARGPGESRLGRRGFVHDLDGLSIKGNEVGELQDGQSSFGENSSPAESIRAAELRAFATELRDFHAPSPPQSSAEIEQALPSANVYRDDSFGDGPFHVAQELHRRLQLYVPALAPRSLN